MVAVPVFRYTAYMCRLAAYIGPELPLAQLLLHPHHSLMKQSWGPQEMKEGKLNADGYGFGWYKADGQAACYNNPMPIWTDPNLESLSETLRAPLWLANVRSATRSMDVSHANTQPFSHQQFIFLHNGYIKDFPGKIRHRIRCLLSEEIESTVRGSTDSEHIFALFLQLLVENPGCTLEQGVLKLVEIIEQDLGSCKVLLNLLLSDGKSVCAIRHAINGESPSLYTTNSDPDYSNAHLIASERLTPSKHWESVPDHYMVTIPVKGEMKWTSLV